MNSRPLKKLLAPHASDCLTRDWLIDCSEVLPRDRLGRRRARTFTSFVLWRCNSTECGARLLTLEQDVRTALGI